MDTEISQTQRVLRQIAFFALILTVASGITVALIKFKKDPEKKPRKVSPILVETISVKRTPVTFTVTTQGSVSPRIETGLHPQVSGQIIWVSPAFYAGGAFAQDEVLVKIDPSDAEARVARAEAALAQRTLILAQEEAQAQQARQDWQALNRGEEASALVLRTPQLKEAQANVKAAQAELEVAQRNLQRTQVRAPYPGMVRTKNVDLGQYVTPATRMGEIFAIDAVELRLPITSEEAAFLELPMAWQELSEAQNKPEVTLQANFAGKDHYWLGEIVRTEGTIDPRSRVLYAVAQVHDPFDADLHPQADVPLSPGLFTEAVVRGVKMDDIIALPRHVLRGVDEVLVVNDDDTLAQRTVTVVRAEAKTVFISGGLEDGERISLTAVDFMVEGMKVQTVKEDGADVEAVAGTVEEDQEAL